MQSPDTLSNASPTGESSQDLQEPSTNISDLVVRVYSQVRQEYIQWSQHYARDKLRSCSSRPHSGFAVTNDVCDETDPLVQSLRAFGSEDGSPTVAKVLPSENAPVVSVTALPSHPAYEASAPISQNIFKGDDADEMRFIPYADEPSFNWPQHVHQYGSFAWQTELPDPDSEVVIMEAAYRLNRIHGLSFESIDATGILSDTLVSTPGRIGLISRCLKRDMIDWPGNSITDWGVFASLFVPAEEDTRTRLGSMVDIFCPNLNCVQPLCSVHLTSNPLPPPKKPTMTIEEVLSTISELCSPECFMNNPSTDFDSPVGWDEYEVDDLRLSIETLPDSTPCDLAVLCFKPCKEVFQWWYLLYPNKTKDGVVNAQNKDMLFMDMDASKFTPNEPCNHRGPCTAESDCACHQNNAHCLRNCHCSSTCQRRWRGCRCSKLQCTTDKCICRAASRECDPELCVQCRCKEVDGGNCRNSQIQHGFHKEIEVRKSQWGLGAFLREPAKAGDLVSEYVGELIYEPTFESRGDLANHRGRSYVYGLNSSMSIDSSFAGNVSRFINHVEGFDPYGAAKRANCKAFVRLVNGDHRIGIFALEDIEAGKELLLDYGSEFFTNEKHGDVHIAMEA